MMMSNFQVELTFLFGSYVTYYYRWTDREDYEEAIRFLTDVLGKPGTPSDAEPVVFLVWNREQARQAQALIDKQAATVPSPAPR